jgi:hypothetical protein
LLEHSASKHDVAVGGSPNVETISNSKLAAQKVTRKKKMKKFLTSKAKEKV